jgi:uncharacterized repeat protein (TIGR01451 family)
MGRERTTDLSLVVGVVLSAAVLAASLLAVTGFASLVAAPPLSVEASQSAIEGVEGATGLAIEAETHSGALVPGENINYLVTYKNLGGATSPITVTAGLPGGTFLVQAWWGLGDQPDPGQELPDPIESTDTKIVWGLPDLPAGETRWFHIELFLDPADLNPDDGLAPCWDISPASDETSDEDNHFCTYDVLNPSGPNLAVSKSHEWTTPDFSELRYEIRVWNWGTAGYEAVWLTDTLPTGTSWTGGWGSDVEVAQVITTTEGVRFEIPFLDRGDSGRIWITATVDAPDMPSQFFTNTVEIDTPTGDVRPADNVGDNVVVSPKEVHAVDVHVATDRSRVSVWTPLVPTGYITVTTIVSPTTPIKTVGQPIGPDCRCAEFPDIGPVYPGNLIRVEAGEASQPVTVTVPVPFDATANSEFNSVSGSIDFLDFEGVEVALYDGPVRLVYTTMGGFGANFPDVPRGAVGEVRYRTVVDFADVTYRRRFYTNDLVFNVHVRDDWIEGYFEAGYPLQLQVTESFTPTVKGIAELDTGFPPWWEGLSGFTTLDGDPWVPSGPPDIQPGDWVFGLIEAVGADGALRVGEISGTVHVFTDTVRGTVSAPWLANPVRGECVVVGEAAPPIEFVVNPSGGEYVCDFGALGEDLLPGDQVLVSYRQDDGHRVMNQFPLPPPAIGVGKQGLGNPGSGGNFEYLVTLFNDGGGPAVETVMTDTLPVGMGFLGQTSTFTATVVGPQIVFDVGVLEPGVLVDFSLFTHVTAPPSLTYTVTVTNTVEVTATNVVTGTASGPALWPNVVFLNDTDLAVAAIPSAALPDPDSDLLWTVEVCNLGTTSSATAMFTTTLPAATPLTGWIPDAAGWSEVAMTPELLAATRPTVPDGACFLHHLTTYVPSDASPGQQLCLTAEVLADGDSDPFNDAVVECVYVSGSAPAIDIEKFTNGRDADGPPGPLIAVGQPVEWVYEVANTGNVTLTAVTVEDDQPGVTPACPSDVLGPDDVMFCSAAGVAVEGQYANTGTAMGTPPLPTQVSDSDPSHYLGVVLDLIFADGFESGTTSAWSRDSP